MEFTFDNNIPIYIQLLEYLKIYLISGVFKSGEKLPSVRDFANIFKVNPNTMQKALSELEEMKLIYTERTNGKYVTKNTKLIEKLNACNMEQIGVYAAIVEVECNAIYDIDTNKDILKSLLNEKKITKEMHDELVKVLNEKLESIGE